MRSYRESKRPSLALVDAPPAPADPSEAVAVWASERLIVPAGHPLAGRAMTLPDYGIEFLRDVFKPEINEALFCCGRKNAKSAIVAVLFSWNLYVCFCSLSRGVSRWGLWENGRDFWTFRLRGHIVFPWALLLSSLGLG